MKFLIKTFGVLAALSLFPAAAQQEKGSVKKKAPSKETPAKAPAVKTVDGGKVEKKIIGKWAPDPEAMMKEIQKGLADNPSAALPLPLPLIQAIMKNMAVKVQKGEITIHAMGEKQTATYKITKVDKAANKLTMQITGEEGAGEGSATVEEKKDGSKTLTLEKDGEKFVLNSITASEFEKRRNADAKPPIFPGPK
jgi:hypothetical protein